MQFLINYGMFCAKLLTVALVIIAVIGIIFGLMVFAKSKSKGKLEVTKLNDKYKDYKNTLSYFAKPKKEFKQFLKSQKKEPKPKNKPMKRLFVLNFQGDIRASAVNALREEITALLTLAEPSDEVLVRLDSAGGLVNAYGLAASQLQRITAKKIKLTVAIDKMAASGGYLMACVANRILAAPFSIVGSIGVVAELPNFHRYLQGKNIDFEQLTAGEYKRTLTLFGENTEKDREKMQQEINETHTLFKNYIKEHRPVIDIDQVSTGEHWYGTQAIHYQLVDELQTSDDYLLVASREFNILEISYKIRKTLAQRFSQSVNLVYHHLLGRGLG